MTTSAEQGLALSAGPVPEEARATALLLHGRGATAESILGLARELALPDVSWLAPQAAGRTWYPASFLAPTEANQPHLDSALERLDRLIAELDGRGVAASRLALVGFSQGACLALEYAHRHPRRYGALVGLTGGLVGPPGTRFRPTGSLAGTAVFLSAGDPDPHVPWWRVEETAEVLSAAGAAVTLRRYPGLPHTVHAEQIEIARGLLAAIGGGEEARS